MILNIFGLSEAADVWAGKEERVVFWVEEALWPFTYQLAFPGISLESSMGPPETTGSRDQTTMALQASEVEKTRILQSHDGSMSSLS